jgi:4-amino-4-deoxychorismate lyase
MLTGNNQALITSINGILSSSVSTLDRGFNYGDGVFETILCVAAKPTLWQLHKERLEYGLQKLSISLDIAMVESLKDDFIKAVVASEIIKDGVLKIVVTRGEGSRGYAPVDCQPNVVISWFSTPEYCAAKHEHGVSAKICKIQLGVNPQLAEIKHLNRLEQILAAQELQTTNSEEGILLDTDAHIIEAVSKNIFFSKNNQLYTPLLKRAGVKGVMRDYIINHVAPR